MKKTNHIMWAIITVITGGIGAIAWVAVALSNNQYNKKHQVVGVYVEEKEEVKQPDSPYTVVIGAIFAIAALLMLPIEKWINQATGSTHGDGAVTIMMIGVVLGAIYEIYKYVDFNKKNGL